MPPGFAGDISADDSGRLLIETSRVVLGREVPVTVVAVPEITDGSLTVRPIEIELSAMGLRLPATRLPASRQPPRVDLPALPAGLRWSTATAVPDGLQLTVEGTDVTVPQRATADGGKCSGGAA